MKGTEQRELNRDLHHAAEDDDPDEIIELLDRGADVNARDDTHRTALMLSSLHGYMGNVKALVDRGADVNAMDVDGWSPADWAVITDHHEVVAFLISRGADVEKRATDGSTLLMGAIASGCKISVPLLLSHGVDITAADNKGLRAIHYAISQGHAAAMRALFDLGEAMNGTIPGGKSYEEACAMYPECVAILRARNMALAIEEVIQRALQQELKAASGSRSPLPSPSSFKHQRTKDRSSP
jgi:ankyrin repeat protein